MSSSERARTVVIVVRRTAPWLVLLAVASLNLSWGLARESLWLDETFSAAMARHSAAEILTLARLDVHPPLYYLLLRGVTLIGGGTELMLRLPSMLSVLALVVLGAGPVTRLAGRRAGLTFGALATTAPGLLAFAQEARMYGLAMVLVLANLSFGVLAVRDGRRRDAALYATTATLAAYTHYYALIAVAWTGLALVLLAARAGALRRILPAQAAAAVAYLPWLPSLVAQIGSVRASFWIPVPGWKLVRSALLGPFSFKFEDLPPPWTAGASLAVLAVLVVVGGVLLTRRRRLECRNVVVLALVVHALVLGTGLALCWLVRPVFMPRYLMVVAGTLLMAVALAIDGLPWRGARAGAITALVLLSAPTVWTIHTQRFNGDSRAVAAFIELERAKRSRADGDLFLYTDSMVMWPMREHIRTGRHAAIYPAHWWVPPADDAVYRDPAVALVPELASALAGARTVWLIDTATSPFPNISAQLLARPGWRQMTPVRRWEPPYSAFAKMSVTRFERDKVPGSAGEAQPRNRSGMR